MHRQTHTQTHTHKKPLVFLCRRHTRTHTPAHLRMSNQNANGSNLQEKDHQKFLWVMFYLFLCTKLWTRRCLIQEAFISVAEHLWLHQFSFSSTLRALEVDMTRCNFRLHVPSSSWVQECLSLLQQILKWWTAQGLSTKLLGAWLATPDKAFMVASTTSPMETSGFALLPRYLQNCAVVKTRKSYPDFYQGKWKEIQF